MHALRSSAVLYSLFFIILTSCTSAPPQTRTPPESSSIYKAARVIENICNNTTHPQFLAHTTIKTDKISSPSFEWEGVWRSNFEDLQARILGSLGEDLMSFRVGPEGLHITQASAELRALAGHSFLPFLEKIQPYDLRQLICGGYAWGVRPPKEKKEDVQIQQEIQNASEYIIQSTYEWAGHRMNVESHVHLSEKREGMAITMKSSFFYGLFDSDSEIEVRWMGSLNGEQLTVHSVIITHPDVILSLNIDDFS